jgi:glycerol uptake facilitator-like aquaporin
VTIAAKSRIGAPVLLRPLLAEALGTGVLVATVVGSGVMAQNLAPGQVLLQLLCNALATVAVLGVLIALLAPVSGSHFNPAVTLAAAVTAGLRWPVALGYLIAQLVGGCLGTVLAHAMFGQALVQWTGQSRGGAGQLLGEVVATAGLLLVITALIRDRRTQLVPVAVPAWIFAAYFFTSSTSFANPAVTVGRALTGSFAGIAPASVPAFVLAQLAGAALGVGLAHVLRGRTR